MWNIGTCATINPRHRQEMEDTFAVKSNLVDKGDLFVAMFDGHGGKDAAQWCANNFGKVFRHQLLQLGQRCQKIAVLNYTFTTADQLLPQGNQSGCTAAVAYLYHSDRQDPRQLSLCLANTGDTRIVLCNNGAASRLTTDHTCQSAKERRRVRKSGGIVLHNRVSGILQLSRSLGDHDLRPYVCCAPYTAEITIIPGDEFIILATDGVWHVLKDQEAVDIVRMAHNPQQGSQAIVDQCLQRGSRDNISCIVIKLGNLEKV